MDVSSRTHLLRLGRQIVGHGDAAVLGHPDVPVYDCNRLAIEHASNLYALARSGIRPAPRSYGQPKGRQAAAFAAALSNWSRVDLPVA